MELCVLLLVPVICLQYYTMGLIVLKPESDSANSEDFQEFPEWELMNRLVDISKADLSAYKDDHLVRPYGSPASDSGGLVYDDVDMEGDNEDEYPQEEIDPHIQDPDYSSAPNLDDYMYDDVEMEEIPEVGRRRKRSVVGRVDAKVEVLVVVDNAIYRRYEEKTGNQRQALAMLRQYYGMVFSMVNQRFQTIDDPELSISVKISGIVVSESREDSAWLEYLVTWSRRRDMGRVNANKALKKFIKWLLANKSLPKYDHAMAFTGYQLINKHSIDLGGMAYVSSICNSRDGNSASIVADPGDFQVVKVATHELAHSLGATHDGDKTNKDCPPGHNYIMAPQTTNEHSRLKNAFYFSRCSVRQMKKLLRSDAAACVRDAPVEYYQYNLERQPPGQRYTADEQCKLIFGKGSEFCETEKMKSVMCGQLWCKDPENGRTCRTHSYLTALPGTTCGEKNKVCHLGECQRNPYGERPTGRIRFTQLQRQATPVSRQGLQSRLPTFRTRVRQNNTSRANRRRQGGSRRQGGNRSWRRRLRVRGRAGRQKARNSGQCQADENQKYCEGLIKLNPRVCRRKAVRKYCCRTCGFRRRRRS